ncbi:DUF6680 family protein [Bosea sp. ANAM02]|uniref:DUF6680 family protein n=1 Tax=Bosea sp. ANAM02 TaxID=2020412 RepID=UPI00140F0ECB|nr:DUF6680 family protein [Bosea sp. ANAM02]BCB20063.1 hypothetical protein OCUBac02_29570 [Bosea sp. ANAM02]
MQFLSTIEVKDWLMISATILGPILAVQAQKAIERWRSRREAKLRIFYVLMANRATQLAPEHVHALNQIDLEFLPAPFWLAPWQYNKDKAVTSAWALYSQTLNKDTTNITEAEFVSWRDRCNDLFYDLLHKISLNLGFHFDRAQLSKGAYHPTGHWHRERLQNMVLEGAAKVLWGEQELKMAVTALPEAPEAAPHLARPTRTKPERDKA